MPRGTYALAGGGTEEFSCAAGPAGWRYVSAGLDLTLDSGGRQLRVEFRSGGWVLRGGVSGPRTLWTRVAADPAATVPAGRTAAGAAVPAGGAAGGGGSGAEAGGFAGESPGLLVAAARVLRLEPAGRARLRLVAVTGDALATRVVEQGWELVDVVPHGPLTVARYRVAALDTGEVADVHLAGDVVLAGPGAELVALGSPPGTP